ncbi:MAG: NAD(+)/NADH kinase [Thermodesulfobacteriota bacterium]|nr:NAD(+)/NADH kinase [Thermodesulfobacteriota bacterium]
MNKDRIGIVCKEDNRDVLALVARVLKWLEKGDIPYVLEDHIAAYLGQEYTVDVWSNANLLVAIGGDGTLLRAARLSSHRNVPILGVHMGSLGFLTEITEDKVEAAIEAILSGEGEYVKDKRTMFETTLIRDDNIIASKLVLNDAVINKGALARIIDIEVWVNTTFITRYRADGLILSTPTGSTAYNLAAHGPIVYPHVPAIILTPICPHVLSNRSIVLPDSQEVEIVLSAQVSSGNVYLTLDGQRGYPMEGGDKVVVKKARHKAVLMRSPKRDFFEVLRTKLRWQER